MPIIARGDERARLTLLPGGLQNRHDLSFYQRPLSISVGRVSGSLT